MSEFEQEERMSTQIKLKYVKSNLFRVIHTDGAIADLNPSGNLTINLFSQRFTIPEEIIVNLDEEGDVINETVLPSSGNDEKNKYKEIIREVDVIAIMDIDVARYLAAQILSQIEEYDEEELVDEDSDI
jgi:hypothetical protein